MSAVNVKECRLGSARPSPARHGSAHLDTLGSHDGSAGITVGSRCPAGFHVPSKSLGRTVPYRAAPRHAAPRRTAPCRTAPHRTAGPGARARHRGKGGRGWEVTTHAGDAQPATGNRRLSVTVNYFLFPNKNNLFKENHEAMDATQVKSYLSGLNPRSGLSGHT